MDVCLTEAGKIQAMRCQKLGFLGSVLCKWQSQTTLIGKAVLPVLLVIRLVTLGAAVTTWLSDYDEFECNTAMPGCQVVCYSLATPLSPARLWTLQLVLVLASGLVFLCYLIHLTNQDSQVKTGNGKVKSHTLEVYLACVAFVILVEVGSVVMQSLLYGFWVNTGYICRANPCPYTVDCIIPQAWEKTVFLVAMFIASCVSMLLSVVEGVCVLLRAKPWRRQPDSTKAPQPESEVKEGRCFLRKLLALLHSHAGLLGKTVLPVLQLIRLVVLGAAVQPVWHNDPTHFICNSQQPGCSQAVYNKVFSFSLQQYWTLQVVLVLAPGLIFLCYLVHIIVMERKKGPGDWIKGRVLGAYLGLLSAVFLIEVGFAVGQAVIFGFRQFASINAGVIPCPVSVDCYVFQAQEKAVFMVIMFTVACLSGLLTLVEMCVVLRSERPWEKRPKKAISETSGFQMESMVKKEAHTTSEGCTNTTSEVGKSTAPAQTPTEAQGDPCS